MNQILPLGAGAVIGYILGLGRDDGSCVIPTSPVPGQATLTQEQVVLLNGSVSGDATLATSFSGFVITPKDVYSRIFDKDAVADATRFEQLFNLTVKSQLFVFEDKLSRASSYSYRNVSNRLKRKLAAMLTFSCPKGVSFKYEAAILSTIDYSTLLSGTGFISSVKDTLDASEVYQVRRLDANKVTDLCAVIANGLNILLSTSFSSDPDGNALTFGDLVVASNAGSASAAKTALLSGQVVIPNPRTKYDVVEAYIRTVIREYYINPQSGFICIRSLVRDSGSAAAFKRVLKLLEPINKPT